MRLGSDDVEGLRPNGTSRTDAGEVSGTGVTSLEDKRSESEHDGLYETETDEVSESIDHAIVASNDKHRTSQGGGKALGAFSITGLLVHSSSE